MDPSTYLERLTGRDLELLARASGATPDRLRSQPERLESIIASPEAFDLLFAPWSEDPLVLASPFLAFSVLLARTAADLNDARFVHEWVAPNQRLPLFDVDEPRAFANDPELRLHLADVLASYTHVVSGSMWVRGARGWTRRRFSELDPARMAELIGVVPDRERAAVLRRLGDLTLFLAGVFPDHAGDRLLRPIQADRIRRVMRELRDGGDGEDPESVGAIGLLERLGSRSYLLAWRETPTRWRGAERVLRDVAQRFRQGRRVLNVLTERFLFPRRSEWFGGS